VLLRISQPFHKGFYKAPYRRLQPFVVENAHIKCLMPVFDGTEDNTGAGQSTFFGHHADADPFRHKRTGSAGGVDGADDLFFHGSAACPLSKAVFDIVVKDDLGLPGNLLWGEDGKLT